METEFNLSEKIFEKQKEAICFGDCIPTEDIKEFIKRLKIDFKEYLNISKGINDVDYIIDKLAGQKLI